MVSFQCEVCNDVIKKPKLDAHRGQCPGAYYSCIDCGITFNGIEYRSHTKCISEKDKYEKTGAGAVKNGAVPAHNGHANGKSVRKSKDEVKGSAANLKKRKRNTPSDSDSSDSSEESSEEEEAIKTKTKTVTTTTKEVKMKESSESESESDSSDEEESNPKLVKAVTKKAKTKESSESKSDSSDEEETQPKNVNVKAKAKQGESSDSNSDSSEEESEDEAKPAKKAKVEINGTTEAKSTKAKKNEPKTFKGYSDNPRERTKQILDKILAARKDGISLHSLRKEVVKVAKVLRLEERQEALKAKPLKKGKKPKLQHKDKHLAGAKFFKNFKVLARDGEIKMEMM